MLEDPERGYSSEEKQKGRKDGPKVSAARIHPFSMPIRASSATAASHYTIVPRTAL